MSLLSKPRTAAGFWICSQVKPSSVAAETLIQADPGAANAEGKPWCLCEADFAGTQNASVTGSWQLPAMF